MQHQKNKEGKIILLYDDDERISHRAATTLVERGYDNLFMVSGGETGRKRKADRQASRRAGRQSSRHEGRQADEICFSICQRQQTIFENVIWIRNYWEKNDYKTYFKMNELHRSYLLNLTWWVINWFRLDYLFPPNVIFSPNVITMYQFINAICPQGSRLRINFFLVDLSQDLFQQPSWKN